ncbi:MAG TPA: hypothetical protein PKG96_08705 [Bacilli bacterium]|nr:hypothetical protein [Bacteroidales bacterium]HOD62161.1 hypothetical protein [Bacilli bacterium]
MDEYIKFMCDEEKSLNKISVHLNINKKTAFDWRHKILSGIAQSKVKPFQGIIESDETFFLHSEKGVKTGNEVSKERWWQSTQKGNK